MNTNVIRQEQLCTGAHGLQRTPEDIALEINQAWHHSYEKIMDVARLCAEAAVTLSASDRKRLVKLLPFERSRFEKLAKVGSDHRLNDPKIIALLPPRHSTLYEIANLNNEEFNAALNERVIHPGAKRAGIIFWRKAYRGDEQKRPEPKLPGAFSFGIKSKQPLVGDEFAMARRDLLEVCERLSLELVVGKSRVEQHGVRGRASES